MAEIIGAAELSRNMRTLSEDMKKKVGRNMVAAAGRIIKNEARSVAKSKGLVKTGSLIKNIVIKFERDVPEGTVQYNLGVRNGASLTRKQKANSNLVLTKTGRIARRYVDNPFYWRFLELGTKYIKGLSYLAPALDSGKERAIQAMGEKLKAEMDKAGAKP